MESEKLREKLREEQQEQGRRSAEHHGKRMKWLPRWLQGVLASLVALVVILGACEWMEWPFLRRPLESRLSDTLKREVNLGEQFGVRFLGRLRLHTDLLVLGPPPEGPTLAGQAPALLRASQIRLALPYSTIFAVLRGPKNDASAPPKRLSVTLLDVEQLEANLIRNADGKVNWNLGAPEKRDTGPLRLPEFGRLEVHRGEILLDDAITRTKFKAEVRTLEESAASDGQDLPGKLEVIARGTYRDQPLFAELHSNGLLPLAESGSQTPPVTLRLEMRLGRSSLSFDGSARDVVHLGSLDGKFFLAGPSLAAVGDSLGVTLPTTASFVMDGHTTKEGEIWTANVRALSIGTSRLNGSFRYDPTLPVPKLSGKLGGARLSMPDLGPAIGASPKAAEPRTTTKAPSRTSARAAARKTPRPQTQTVTTTETKDTTRPLAPIEISRRGAVAPGTTRDASSGGTPSAAPSTSTSAPKTRVLPQREFDIPSLAAMDADVAVDLSLFHLGTEQLEQVAPLQARIVLDRQVLTFQDISARTASGDLHGTISLDAREKNPLWRADLRWSGVQLERFFKPRNVAEAEHKHGYISGTLSGHARLHGTGRSTAQMLASLDGDMQLWVRSGRISHFLVEVVGLDVAQGLGMLVRGDDTLPMTCAVGAFEVRDGNVRSQAIVIDTRDSTLSGTGTVSLANERLDLVFRSQPKDISPLTLRTPISIGGTFADPDVRLEKSSIAVKLVAAAALAAITPVAALLALVDLGEPEKKVCQEAIQRVQPVARSTAANARPER